MFQLKPNGSQVIARRILLRECCKEMSDRFQHNKLRLLKMNILFQKNRFQEEMLRIMKKSNNKMQKKLKLLRESQTKRDKSYCVIYKALRI